MAHSHTLTWSCDREKYLRIISSDLEQCYVEEFGEYFGYNWNVKITFERIAKPLEVDVINSSKKVVKKTISRHNYVFNLTLQRTGKDLCTYTRAWAKLVYGAFVEDVDMLFHNYCEERVIGSCDTSSLDDYKIDVIFNFVEDYVQDMEALLELN